MTCGVLRFLRISTDEALINKDWVIPPGTPVGLSTISIHENETISPFPKTFRPERWPGEGRCLEKCLFTFSKGSCQCDCAVESCAGGVASDIARRV
jgi:cytochrome P450